MQSQNIIKRKSMERAAKAQKAIIMAYSPGESLDQDNIQDILADIMHLCKEWGIDFNNKLRLGRDCYDAESRGDFDTDDL